MKLCKQRRDAIGKMGVFFIGNIVGLICIDDDTVEYMFLRFFMLKYPIWLYLNIYSGITGLSMTMRSKSKEKKKTE